jgi:hypothetical protein
VRTCTAPAIIAALIRPSMTVGFHLFLCVFSLSQQLVRILSLCPFEFLLNHPQTFPPFLCLNLNFWFHVLLSLGCLFIYFYFLFVSFNVTADSYEAYHTPLVHSGRKGSGFMTGMTTFFDHHSRLTFLNYGRGKSINYLNETRKKTKF